MFCGNSNKLSSEGLALCSGPRRQNCQHSLGSEQESVAMKQKLAKLR